MVRKSDLPALGQAVLFDEAAGGYLRNASLGMPGFSGNAAYSDLFGLSCPEPTLAQQQFKDDNDPNVVMQKFARSRDMELFQRSNPQYGDFTGANDLQSALNIVIAADSAFEALPARIRSRFNNDAVEFAEFLNDKSNFDEAKALGLLREDAKSMLDAPSSADVSESASASTAETPATGEGKK